MALPNPFAWHTASAICFPPTVFDGAISLLRAWDGGGIYRLRPRSVAVRLKNMLTLAEQILAASASLGSDERRLHRFRPLGPWPRREQPEVKDGGHWVTEASDADIR